MRRPRFPHFPRGPRAGGLLVLMVALAAFLAAGAPGAPGPIAGDVAPSEEWLDQQAREQLRLDELDIATDTGEDQALVDSVLTGKTSAIAAAKPKPLRRIDFRAMAYRAAVGAGIKRPGLFVRQMAAESGFQPCAGSPAGAIGIAQIMPETARGWGVDPWVPADALQAAAKAMAKYERQLGSYRLALAAYNAGTGAVARFGGVPPYAETQEYIRRVMTISYKLPGMTQVFDIPQRMKPEFAGRLRLLAKDVRSRGATLEVEEAWRSYEDSMRIWKAAKRKRGGWKNAKVWAAPPGCSNHVRGLAADLQGNLALAKRLAPKYGLVFPMAHEPWHVELAGIRTQSG
ncbi:MAG: Lytic transglycosylase catalytic [Thermoleophilia bacterium]|nr:Lytic transglycosylase catalytic [Thermoleophilia bacterium]